MNRIKILITLSASLALFSIGSAAGKNASGEIHEGSDWTSLFDGVSLGGWRGYLGADITAAWSVVDGELVLRGGSEPDHYINVISERQFKDFDLRFEWKIEPGSNSGVMYHVKEGPRMPYLTGPEYQILDNEGFRGSKGQPVTREEYTGSHYAIEAPRADVMKPIGEWNSSRILVVGNHVQYFLNGALTAEFEMHSLKWNAQVAAAKFAKWKDFGTTDSGHIALQDHGHGAWFRNIRIKEL